MINWWYTNDDDDIYIYIYYIYHYFPAQFLQTFTDTHTHIYIYIYILLLLLLILLLLLSLLSLLLLLYIYSVICDGIWWFTTENGRFPLPSELMIQGVHQQRMGPICPGVPWEPRETMGHFGGGQNGPVQHPRNTTQLQCSSVQCDS